MPHTRAARLKALKEASDLRDMLQLHDTSTNPGWNDYLDWDLPGVTYEPESSSWFPVEGATTIDHPPFFGDAHSPTINSSNGALDINYARTSNTNFCGLQPWYSTATRDLSSASPPTITQPQLSTSALTSYDSTSFDEQVQQTDSIYAGQPWSLKVSRRHSSLDDEMDPRRLSNAQEVELVEDDEEHPSPSSEEENERISMAKSAAHKKRKIAHSVIEKNYRCRIKDGMAELRHCVPHREKGRRSMDSEGHSITGDVGPNHSSGKVAILSDAVQYVKALERQNEALHGQLDVMQRRNNTLQKIALSKVDTMVSVEEVDDQVGTEPVARGQSGQANNKGKKIGVRGKEEERFKAVAYAPSFVRRYGGGTKGVTGTLAGIKISGY